MLLSVVLDVKLKVNYNVCRFLRHSLPPATSTALPPLGKKFNDLSFMFILLFVNTLFSIEAWRALSIRA